MRRILLMLFMIATSAMTIFAQSKGKVTMVLLDNDTKSAVIGAVVEVYPTASQNSKKYYTL